MLKISKIKLIAFFSLIGCINQAQTNLVPNGSFETYTSCPPTANGNAPDYVTYATGWHSSLGTPDYFNSCSSPTTVSTPLNNFGFQIPYNGNCYCGFYCYNKYIYYREIISAQLNSSLSVGQKYFVSIKVSLADKNYYAGYGINKIGTLFSTKQYSVPINQAPINNFSQVYSTSIITDSINWVLISGSFYADSAYQFINIGNFFNDNNTDTISVNTGLTNSYYFVDDVRVSTDSVFGLALGLKELKDDIFQFYPNPSKGIVHYSVNNSQASSKIKILNSIGCILFEGQYLQSGVFDFSFLDNGIFYLELFTEKKVIRNKLIIQK